MKDSKDFKKILAVLGVVALGIFALHYWMYTDIKSKSQNISSLEYDLSTRSSKQDYLIATDRALNNLETSLDVFNDSIVLKDDDISFIERVESIARSYGLTIEIQSLTIKPQDLPSQDLTTLNVKAKTVGSWRANYMFLVELENLPIKLKIGKSSLVRVSSEASSGVVWSNDIDITVLKYK